MRWSWVKLGPISLAIFFGMVAALFLAGCSLENGAYDLNNEFNCSDDFIERHGSEIWFCGSIDIGDFAAVEDVFVGNRINSFLISSQGGNGAEARKISSLLRSNNIDVIIDGECLSACAHFIMMTAKRVSINEGAIVAFHSTASGLLAYQMRVKENFQPSTSYTDWIERGIAEGNFYLDVGLPTEWLVEPMYHLQFDCIGPVYKDVDGEFSIVAAHSIYDFWIPNWERMLKVHPGDVTGWWPANKKEMYSAVRIIPNHDLNFVFGGGELPDTDVLPMMLPDCP